MANAFRLLFLISFLSNDFDRYTILFSLVYIYSVGIVIIGVGKDSRGVREEPY